MKNILKKLISSFTFISALIGLIVGIKSLGVASLSFEQAVIIFALVIMLLTAFVGALTILGFYGIFVTSKKEKKKFLFLSKWALPIMLFTMAIMIFGLLFIGIILNPSSLNENISFLIFKINASVAMVVYGFFALVLAIVYSVKNYIEE